MMTDDEIVEFVRTHKGTWNNAMFGYAYRFDAPELRRSPFTARRLNRLIDEGRIKRDGGGQEWFPHGDLVVVR